VFSLGLDLGTGLSIERKYRPDTFTGKTRLLYLYPMEILRLPFLPGKKEEWKNGRLEM
jgi:hypothetical protein